MLNFSIGFGTLEVVDHDGFGMLDGTGFLCIVEPERIHFHRGSGIRTVFSYLIGVARHGIGPAPVIFQHHVHPVGIECEDVLYELQR